MTDSLITSVVTIATGIIGVAALAVIVSRNAQTPAVLSAAGSAFGGALSAAVSPVMGGNTNSFYMPSTFTQGGAGYNIPQYA